MGLHIDIDPRTMSRATRIYLGEQHAINEAHGVQPEDVSAEEEKRVDLIARHPSMHVPSFPEGTDMGHPRNTDSETEGRKGGEIVGKHSNVTAPSWRDSESRARSPAPVGSGSAGTHDCSHSVASNSPVHHEDGRPVDNLSKEHDKSITNNGCNGAADAATPQGGGDDTWSDFRPHILHEPHEPVPIAAVNRWPKGSKSPASLSVSCKKCLNGFCHVGPGHYRLRKVPQNVAWRSAMRYAQRNVFMSVPNLL
jgi:hypothetical protein